MQFFLFICSFRFKFIFCQINHFNRRFDVYLFVSLFAAGTLLSATFLPVDADNRANGPKNNRNCTDDCHKSGGQRECDAADRINGTAQNNINCHDVPCSSSSRSNRGSASGSESAGIEREVYTHYGSRFRLLRSLLAGTFSLALNEDTIMSSPFTLSAIVEQSTEIKQILQYYPSESVCTENINAWVKLIPFLPGKESDPRSAHLSARNITSDFRSIDIEKDSNEIKVERENSLASLIWHDWLLHSPYHTLSFKGTRTKISSSRNIINNNSSSSSHDNNYNGSNNNCNSDSDSNSNSSKDTSKGNSKRKEMKKFRHKMSMHLSVSAVILPDILPVHSDLLKKLRQRSDFIEIPLKREIKMVTKASVESSVLSSPQPAISANSPLDIDLYREVKDSRERRIYVGMTVARRKDRIIRSTPSLVITDDIAVNSIGDSTSDGRTDSGSESKLDSGTESRSDSGTDIVIDSAPSNIESDKGLKSFESGSVSTYEILSSGETDHYKSPDNGSNQYQSPDNGSNQYQSPDNGSNQCKSPDKENHAVEVKVKVEVEDDDRMIVQVTELLPPFYDILLHTYTYKYVHPTDSSSNTVNKNNNNIDEIHYVADLPSFVYTPRGSDDADCYQSYYHNHYLESSVNNTTSSESIFHTDSTNINGKIQSCFGSVSWSIEIPKGATLLSSFTALKRYLHREDYPSDGSRGLVVPPVFVTVTHSSPLLYGNKQTDSSSQSHSHSDYQSESKSQSHSESKCESDLLCGREGGRESAVRWSESKLYTSDPVLITFPILDSSMPFNVITLVSKNIDFCSVVHLCAYV
jgi:hypothetical protein